jgi:glycosyltransferase involved in cell wall biosynthesis
MKVDDALVSVIVTIRNSDRTLEACLRSIRSQSHQPIELVVIDNKSSDGSLRTARAYSDILDDFGPERSAQRNRGAFLAHGNFLLFIDSDMMLSQSVVSDCLDVVHAQGVPGVVIPEVSVGRGFLADCRALERSCYVGDDTIEAARFFTRDAFKRSGGFDEHLTGPEDRDLTIRIFPDGRLPRVGSYISHDEGELRLRAVLAKRRYYGGSFFDYWRKHGGSTVHHANLVVRPAFIRNWRRLARHPILSLGIVALKALETGAAIVGILESWLRRRSVHEVGTTSVNH